MLPEGGGLLYWDLWQAFLLVSVRSISFLTAAPFFERRNFSALPRIGLGAGLALVIFPGLPAVQVPQGVPGLAVTVFSEAMTGLAIGLLANLIFNALRTAGQLVDLEMGFAMVSLLDMESGSRSTPLGEYFHLLGMVIFLSLDGHHILIRALAESFRDIPLGAGLPAGPVAAVAVDTLATMFSLAFRMALPFLGVLVVTDVALALVARTVPQLNVFMLSFPLKVGLGVAMLSLLAPLLGYFLGTLVQEMERDLGYLLRAMAP